MYFLPKDLLNEVVSFHNPHRDTFDLVARELEWLCLVSDFRPRPYDKVSLPLLQHLRRQCDETRLLYLSLIHAYFYPRKRVGERVCLVPLLGHALSSDTVHITKRDYILGRHSARVRNTPYELLEDGLIPDTEYLIELGETRQTKIYQMEKFEDEMGVELFGSDDEWLHAYANRFRQSLP